MSLPKLSAFVILVLTSLFLGKSVAAQIPVPSTPVPCGKVTDSEFHSLRPYQASPCDENISGAAFCGNGIAISEQVSETQSDSPSKDPDCTLIDARTRRYKCTYDTHIRRTIAIDLSDAELPILGNTEKVINSRQQSEDLDSAEKTNEYVSWYLNGVTGRAEYGADDDLNDIINFSGPLKKLLPQSIQYKYQIETIEKALAKDVNKDGETQDRERHNQIVVCTNPLGKPTACYGSFLGELVNKEYRLEDWDGTLIATQIRNALISFWTSFLPDYPQEIINDALGDVWEYKTPPLPWQDRFKDNPKKYLKAYNEWRGKTCVLIPFVNLLICHDLPLLSPDNKWADLFPYVPLSSTEDREGSVAISEFGIKATSPDAEVKNQKFTNQSPAELFFAHTEEVSDLASLLQSTYAPEGGSAGSAPSVGIAPNDCSLVNIRSNPGDQLFPGEISGDLSYDLEFSCEYEIPDIGWSLRECRKDVLVSLGTITETPLADEIWSKLVAGPQGVFKRIYPKVGEGGSLECLADIPAATKVDYQGEGLGSVTNPAERSGQSPELYFPHLGGVYEYFLKGIQTALRPKGYGEQVITGQNCENLTCSSGKIGTLPDLPSAGGSCRLSGSGQLASANLSKLPTLVAIVEAAADAFKVPPSLILGVMFGEGAFDRYEWTDENVRNWSLGCTTMPSCNPGSFPSQGVVPYLDEDHWNAVKDAVKVVDPGREPNPCNLLDAVFAVAKDLKGNSGISSFAGKTCFGIPLKTGAANPNSCSWGPSDVETAIKVWETGGQYICLTEVGSCFTGGGLNAACSKGGDNCETVNNYNPLNPSHNACVWNVYQNFK